jgi:hypothetical protein
MPLCLPSIERAQGVKRCKIGNRSSDTICRMQPYCCRMMNGAILITTDTMVIPRFPAAPRTQKDWRGRLAQVVHGRIGIARTPQRRVRPRLGPTRRLWSAAASGGCGPLYTSQRTPVQSQPATLPSFSIRICAPHFGLPTVAQDAHHSLLERIPKCCTLSAQPKK